ncbi:tudor and KH domain-containing protein homolog isoform X2 [Sabethes cyaneus]|nr:tudor and KH domain-containing protein homolog isoform X2 [Sabethes cyaneus]XP_053693798.1 tudor and KH domain-containing protein homolog isoform X2 [Sabethes cyaneus]XP_053693800.1 tudor and KH domain-containing protein homolog isoform X2 [Sabethes cyaneus]
MIQTRAAFPIIIGLSVLSVGAACVYAFLKKKSEQSDSASDEDGFSKISKLVRMISKDESTVIELTLSKHIVPLVTGRKNCTILHIQNCTNTEISFYKKDELYQICKIRGTESGVREAEQLILKEASRQMILTEEVVVPQTACGKILGRCGDALQEICRKSMAKVWIEGSRTPGENRRVMITGTQSQIVTAKSLIEQKVKDDTDFRKSQEHLDIRREPRIRTPPSSLTATPVPREVLPPTVERLKTTSSSGQLEVFVSAVVSPSRFYLQLVGPQSAELDILVETMTEYYNQQENRELHMIRKPYLGQIVAAAFNADSKWYRAEIVAILPNEYKPNEVVLDLYFVDYGDNQYIQPSEVYELRPDFLALRFQAIECFLAHVEANNPVTSLTGQEEWEPAAVSRFEELTHVAQWKKLLSRIATYQNKGHRGSREGREGSPIPGVELYDTIDGMDVNIALELISEGYAKTSKKFGDLNQSNVLRLDGGSRTTSIERLNDVSSASTTSSISSIISTINTSKKTLLESANREPSSVAMFETNVPDFSAINVIELKKDVNSIDHGQEVCNDANRNNAAENNTVDTANISQAHENVNGISNDSAKSEINQTKNGLHTPDWNELYEENAKC